MRCVSKVRAAVVVSALAGLVVGGPALPASATSQGDHDASRYLALGDSVPFGYSPLLVQPGVNPDVFVGYPQLASKLFEPEMKLVNPSCPGEPSTSLITALPPDNAS